MSERIRLLRQHLKLSQTEFAKKMGMTRSMVSNLELGLVEIPEYKLEMISKVFNVRLDWLRTGEGEMFNPVNESLDALAEANNIDPVTRAIVVGLLEMPAVHREPFINLIFKVSSMVNSGDYDKVREEALAAGAQFRNFTTAKDQTSEDGEQLHTK